MKFLKANITTILLVVIAVFVVLQLKSCFDKYHKPEQMIRNEEQLKVLEKQRLSDSVALVDIRGKYDSLIAVSMEKSGQLQTKYKTVKTIYERIPANIRNLNNEDLRRAVWNY